MAFLKTAYFQIAKRSGLNALARSMSAGGFRILTYHGVDADQDPVVNYDRLQVAPVVFREHLQTLSAHFVVRPLAELLDQYLDGSASEPNTVAITFDDGYRNNLEVAADVLREFGFHATFFLTSDYIRGKASPWWYELREAVGRARVRRLEGPNGAVWPLGSAKERVAAARSIEEALVELSELDRRRLLQDVVNRCEAGSPARRYPMLNEDEARQLAEMGFALAPHSVRHVSFRHEEVATCEQELRASSEYVREISGRQPVCFSYPYGHVPTTTRDIESTLKPAGIEAAVTTVPGVNYPGTDRWQLRRYDVNGARDAANLEGYLSGITGCSTSRRGVYRG